ncbi:MAG TPA: hypothetical protein VIT65_06245 [Microlunatus sp.]
MPLRSVPLVGVAHGGVAAVVMAELPSLVRSRIRTQSLTGCLGPSVRRA